MFLQNREYLSCQDTGFSKKVLACKGELLRSVFKPENPESIIWSLRLLFPEDKSVKNISTNNFGYFLDDNNSYSKGDQVIMKIAREKYLISADYENFNYLIDRKRKHKISLQCRSKS
jgi:hypothetical protein